MSRRQKLQRPVRAAVAVAVVSAALLVLPSTPAQAAAQNIDLYAVSGSTTLPNGVAVPVWGYSADGSNVTAPGGPTIAVDQGDSVTVTLHNTLGVKTALFFQGQQMPLDRTGADATGGTRTYTFTASRPGTFLYEAGPVLKTGPADTAGTGTQYQTAMGLHGALVVRPAAGQAYDADSAYDDEAVLVLSEIDPALNTRTTPATFDMRTYVPRYSLINGKSYPATTPITSAGGHTVLLRYVNAGVNYHSMGVLGASQTVVGMDGNKLDFPRTYVAQTFGPGESADALVEVPAAAAQDTSLSVYEASLGLTNRNSAGVGGMLTTVDVPSSGATSDTTGPVTSKVAFLDGTLRAHVDDSARGGNNIAAAEYYVDTVAAGAGLPMVVGSSPTEDASVAVSVPDGQHVLYVRARDAAATANWGPFSSVLVTGADVGGPTTSGPTLTPQLVTHDGGAVRVSATGDDSASGNSNIIGAEYFVDTLGADGTGVGMTVSQAAPVAGVDATIGQAAVNALAEGGHTVFIHTQDAGGNWGTAVTAILKVDTTSPEVAGGATVLFVSPNPSNGNIAYSNGTSSIRLNATRLSDPLSSLVQSPIAGAEMFIDTVGATGTGVPLRAVDGSFSDPVEGAYADIPLATVRTLANGTHTISVRARDAAGNWGAFATTTLVVDKAAPTTTGVTAAPNPTQGAITVTVTATGNDATQVVAGELFRGTDPGVGNGTAMTVSGSGPWTVTGTLDTSALPEGSATVKVRVKDAAGNWGTAVSGTITVTAPLSFSTAGNRTNPARPSSNVYRWNGASMAAGTVYSGPANVDGYAVVDATHAYVSFSATATLAGTTGTFAAADEDVVSYDASTQRYTMVFDGSTNGLGAGGVNVDAVSVAGGKLYYSVNGTARPSGVPLPAGAANDLYRFDGTGVTGTSARVVDASQAPYAMPASDVDGLKFIDATHFYLSFSPTNTALAGLGNVQDEDVVAYNAGTWSVYFDGTAKGLTTDSSDIDAFDLP